MKSDDIIDLAKLGLIGFIIFLIYKMGKGIGEFFKGIKLPEISLPKLPEVKLPKLPEVKLPKLPEVKLPKLPEVKLPKIEISKLSYPKLSPITFPPISLPIFPSKPKAKPKPKPKTKIEIPKLSAKEEALIKTYTYAPKPVKLRMEKSTEFRHAAKKKLVSTVLTKLQKYPIPKQTLSYLSERLKEKFLKS